MKEAIQIREELVNDPLEIIERLRESLEQKDCRIEAQDHRIRLLEEKIQYLLHHRFGAKSERFDERQQALFDDQEDVGEVEVETDIEVPAHTRKRGGRRMPPKDLPRVRVEHDLSEQEKRCHCGECKQCIGEEVSYQYGMEPAKFFLIENVVLKYACRNPQCDEPPVTARQDPPPPLPRTQASASALAWIGASKFADGLALNRIASIAESRFGVPLTSTTLADWMIKGAERLLSPLVGALEEALYQHDYVHADETRFQVLLEQGRRARQLSQMWVRVSASEDQPIVLMDYNPSRGSAIANALLGRFAGYLHTDGYVGYDATASRPDVTQLGCWSHVRRKFDAAAKASSAGAAHIARQGLKLIRDLYHLDNQGKDKPPDERKRDRQEVVGPQLEKIRRWIDDNQGRALGYGGLLATAFTYIHNQWPKLIVFLDDGRLQLDNNKAERHIRPFATGRKVWLFARSEAGAKATAIWYSVVETAKANGLDPYWYLRKILQEMPVYLRDDKPVNDLLPWNINREELRALSGRG